MIALEKRPVVPRSSQAFIAVGTNIFTRHGVIYMLFVAIVAVAEPNLRTSLTIISKITVSALGISGGIRSQSFLSSHECGAEAEIPN